MEDETDYKHLEIIHRLKLSDDNTWHWSRQKPGTIPLPDFIRMKVPWPGYEWMNSQHRMIMLEGGSMWLEQARKVHGILPGTIRSISLKIQAVNATILKSAANQGSNQRGR